MNALSLVSRDEEWECIHFMLSECENANESIKKKKIIISRLKMIIIFFIQWLEHTLLLPTVNTKYY